MKKASNNTVHIISVLSVFICFSCIEEFVIETSETFEDALVVEATMTNEVRYQKIKLSRTFLVDENGPVPESNANMKVKDNEGNVYDFEEHGPGEYFSRIEFAAVQDVEYHLEISTNNGNNYISSAMQLTRETDIDELYIERSYNENGDEGISVFVDSFDPSNSSEYYRFEYEETYKIIAPQYSPFQLVVVNRDFPFPENVLEDLNTLVDYLVIKELRQEQEQICYNTVDSNSIIVTSTSQHVEDRLEQFRVRFINKENYIISQRYSILVRQFVQSPEAFRYYEALNNLSDTESILSETQTGFFQGNLMSLSNPDEKVIGFFDVSSVDSKRIFFNYTDEFPEEDLPPYIIQCNDFVSPPLWNKPANDPFSASSSPLIGILDEGLVYFDDNPEDNEATYPYQPFLLVQPECGDCTSLGTTNIPEFWID